MTAHAATYYTARTVRNAASKGTNNTPMLKAQARMQKYVHVVENKKRQLLHRGEKQLAMEQRH